MANHSGLLILFDEAQRSELLQERAHGKLSVEEIDRLVALRNYSGYRLTGEVSEVLLQEREALGAALDIFSGSNQLRDTVLSSWAPTPAIVGKVTRQLTLSK